MPAPGLVAQALGAALVLLALADVFLTVLHTRADAGIVSTRLNRATATAPRSPGAGFMRRFASYGACDGWTIDPLTEAR